MNTRYDLNMEVPPREAVRLLYISKSRFGGDWRSVPHTHACTEMFYCVSGRGQFNIEGKLFDVAPDDLIIVNPRVQHTELSYQTYPLEYIVLGIDGAEFLFNEKDLGYTMLSCGMMREELLFLMRMLLREIDSRADGCEMVCQDILEVLLVKIVREAAVSMRIVQPPSKSKECAAAKRYIDENFSENITLDKLAEITHVNKYYLSHTFQREYNTSPINYLLNRRITESKALLTSTDFSLTQISEQMGFSSPALLFPKLPPLYRPKPAGIPPQKPAWQKVNPKSYKSKTPPQRVGERTFGLISAKGTVSPSGPSGRPYTNCLIKTAHAGNSPCGRFAL